MGPQSAGADPGPICYAKGGKDPTITDANLVLGRINPLYFLGGQMELDVAAAEQGIREKCATPLGLSVIEAANGIIEIANAAMVNALRLTTIRRGYDPRAFVMIAFGGAGPLHANRLCAEMQIPLLVIPPSPGTTSALGLLATDVKHDFSRTHIIKADCIDAGEISSIFAGMEREGKHLLTKEGIDADNISFLREIEMRYIGQSYELGVACPGGSLRQEDLVQICRSFHSEHEKAYGRGYPQEPVEFVNLRVSAIGAIPRPPLCKLSSNEHNLDDARKGSRSVFFAEVEGFTDTPIYDRYRLTAGQRLIAPAIVEEMDSHTLLHPGFQVDVDPFGNLLVVSRR